MMPREPARRRRRRARHFATLRARRPRPMRIRAIALVLFLAAGAVTLSLIRAQDQPADLPTIVTPTAAPAKEKEKPKPPPAALAPAPAKGRDLPGLTELQKQMLQAGQRGAAWLFRAHGDKGRFVPGYLPALHQPMEGDSDLRQAGAAFALARAARYLHEESYAARATQAVLTLLDDTAVDAKDADVRYPAQPAALVNRLGLAGALVLAVHELPSPQKDLLDRAEQLCNYIRKQAKADGSLACVEGAAASEEEVNLYAGLALR